MEERVQGIYKDGVVTLNKKVSVDNVPVTVIFREERQEYEIYDKMPKEEALEWLERFAGCVKWEGEFDFEKERDEYLNERYSPFN